MRREHELAGSVAGTCFLLAGLLLLLVLLAGCVEHKVTAPQLDAALATLDTFKPPVQCRTIDLMPVPGEVHLDISGDTIKADAGGEQLLRGYVQCRSLGVK